MAKKYEITPNIIITIDINAFDNIPIIIRNIEGELLYYTHIEILNKSNFIIRKSLIELLYNLIDIYKPNMIIFEQNRLFIDGIDMYPDYRVLRNILRGFGIQTSIEDNFYEKIQYIMALPDKEWQSQILNSKFKYSIDLYKSHIQKQEFTNEQLDLFQQHNYYKALCLSESMWFDKLMNKKYQINTQ